LQGTSTLNADSIVTAFPTFAIKDSHAPDGYAHFTSWYYLEDEDSFHSPGYGLWNSETTLFSGIGGSGVTAVFDSDGEKTAVISPLNEFMTASQLSSEGGVRMYGIMGNVTTIPKGYNFETLIYFGETISESVSQWGDLMRGLYSKNDIVSSQYVQSDITLSYLGYITDNGQYYYYKTVPDKNYQDTMLDIKAYADSLNLPYKHYLLDSW
jgi:hypothetical protein